MKKRPPATIFLCILCAALLLGACRAPAPPDPTPTATARPTSSPSPTATATPVPTPTPTPVPIEFDYYTLDVGTREYFGEEYSEYKRLVDAILAQAPEFTMPRESALNAVMLYTAFQTDCLLRSFVSEAAASEDFLTLAFTYRFDAETQAKEIRWMEEHFANIMRENIRPDYTDVEIALEAYTAAASMFAYDYAYDTSNPEIDVYDALKSGYGVCHTYAYAMRFLLAQYDIPVYNVRGFSDEDVHHAWLMAQLGEQWYHFDPTFENGDTFGAGLVYFGMTDAERTAAGNFPKPFHVGIYPYSDDPPAATDDSFSFMRDAHSWRHLPGEHTIRLYHYGATSGLYDPLSGVYTPEESDPDGGEEWVDSGVGDPGDGDPDWD